MQQMLVAVLLFLTPIAQADELEHVSVQFQWLYQFQFAGFIAAKERGFYQQAGLEVTLKEYSPGVDVAEQVDRREANYGVHNSLLVFDEQKLKPVVMLASYFQHSPLVFVTQPSIKHPSDIVGKRLMSTSNDLRHSGLALLLNHFSINRSNTTMVAQTFNIEDFVEGKVDVMSAFRSNEIYELERRGIEYNIIDPTDFGFYTAAVTLYSSQDEVLEHPDRTKRFIEATNRGWEYALQHSDELVEIIYQHYSKQKSREALQFEAEVTKKMVMADLFPIGWISDELGSRLIAQLKNSDLLSRQEGSQILTLEKLIQMNQKQLTLSSAEQRHLLQKGEVRYCIDPDWMPLEGIQNGQHQGISADIFNKIGQMLPVPLRLVHTSSWTESMRALKNGHCDLLSLAAPNEKQAESMRFTAPYLEQPLVMATRNNHPFIADLTTLKPDQAIGVVEGYFAETYIRTRYPTLKLVTVASSTDGFEQVSRGELFGYVDNMLLVASVIQKEYSGEMKISARLDKPLQLAVAVRKQDPMLHQIFQRTVEQINRDPKTKQQIINDWVSVQYQSEVDYALLLKIAIALLVILSLLLYRQRLLKASSARLQQAKNQIDLIVDTMGEGIAVIDGAGQVQLVNQRFEVMSGYLQREIRGKKLSEFFVGKREEESLQSILQDLSTPLGTLFINNPDKFETLTMESPLSALIVDQEGKIQLSNKAFTMLSGWKSEQLIGETLEPLLPEAIRGVHQKMFDQYMASPEARNMGGRRLPLVTVDGNIKELEIGLIPLRKAEESFVMVLLHDPISRRIWEFFKITTLGRLVQESTDRVQLQYQLQQADGGTLPVEVSIATMDEPTDSSTDASAVLVIQDITEHIKQAHRDQYEAFQDGLAEMSATVLHNLGNVVTGVAGAAADCSKRVDYMKHVNKAFSVLNEQLEQGHINHKEYVEKVKLVDTAVEEIRNGKADGTSHGLSQLFADIEHGLRHITDIIRAFRENSQGRVTCSYFNLREMVKDTINLIERQMNGYNIKLVIDIPEEIELNLPRNLTMQMLLNLVKNSIDAINKRVVLDTFSNGRIEIAAALDGDQVILSVSDNGCGIPKALQPTLFDRGSTTKEGSAGLGLHSVANYVQSQKGRQWVESEGENRGACFFTALPHIVTQNSPS